MKRILLTLAIVAIIGAGCSANQTPSDSASVISDPISPALELNLSGKGLTSIPMEVFSKTYLERLRLSNNKLTGAPQSQIGQLTNLTYLDLSGNALTGLPAEIGRLKNLEVLNVSNNKLTGLPLELGDLTNLRVLDVSGNNYSKQDLDQIAAKLTKRTSIIK